MAAAPLELSRAEILGFRRRVGALEARLPMSSQSLRQTAWAGLQDSMPRAALLSIHARVEGTMSSTWEDPSLAQVWGPRFSAFVVAARDVPVFTLGRMPENTATRRRAEDTASRLSDLLGTTSMSYAEAARALGERPNALRYATLTGRILIRWDGARRPSVRVVDSPDVDPGWARLELARRHLHVFGPTTPAAFASWAGIEERAGDATFGSLLPSLTPVRTPIGDGWMLAADEEAMRRRPGQAAPARLLPSGDSYYLLQGADRELLVPDPALRGRLWTSRVWPGAVLVAGEIVGTWRRAGTTVTIDPWVRLTRTARDLLTEEAAALPLPNLDGGIVVEWKG